MVLKASRPTIVTIKSRLPEFAWNRAKSRIKKNNKIIEEEFASTIEELKNTLPKSNFEERKQRRHAISRVENKCARKKERERYDIIRQLEKEIFSKEQKQKLSQRFA